MESKGVFAAQLNEPVQRVDRTGSGCAYASDDCPDVAFSQASFQRARIDLPLVICRNALERKRKDLANSWMGVMGLFRGNDGFAWTKQTGDPKRLQIGHRPASAEMAQMRFPTDHFGQCS